MLNSKLKVYSMFPTKGKKIISVIITYFPNIDNVKYLVSQLKLQDVYPLIVDNGTNEYEGWDELNCDIIKLNSNLGIAEAQNIGIRKAIELKYKYILFFDQDSSIGEFFVSNLLKDYERISTEIYPNKVGTIGPSFKDERFGFYYPHIVLKDFGRRKKISPNNMNRPFEVSFIISSGSMVETSVFDDVGMMRSDFFIDYVDTEWCLRAKNKGYKIYASTSATMVHAIGDNVIKFLGFNIPVHSPFRRYYRVRNSFYFFKMKHVPFSLAVRDTIFNLIHQVIIFIKTRKISYIKSYFRALLDGMFIFIKK